MVCGGGGRDCAGGNGLQTNGRRVGAGERRRQTIAWLARSLTHSTSRWQRFSQRAKNITASAYGLCNSHSGIAWAGRKQGLGNKRQKLAWRRRRTVCGAQKSSAQNGVSGGRLCEKLAGGGGGMAQRVATAGSGGRGRRWRGVSAALYQCGQKTASKAENHQNIMGDE